MFRFTVVVEKVIAVKAAVGCEYNLIVLLGYTRYYCHEELSTARILLSNARVGKALLLLAQGPRKKGLSCKSHLKHLPLPKPIDSSQKPSQAKDKGKGKMVEPENPLKRKDQIMIDEEVARNLKAQMQAELEEEERLVRLKEEETNIALIES
nr:hypothetical protein [Tanacetum cinerariifolium]